ncbi:haloacid dehalogenase-like hydrolase [Alphaproteobacteria bacterium LSUCC0396]
MNIGLDFDNTIACYDVVFHTVAVEKSLIDPSVPVDKISVREHLRENNMEEEWIKLQGFVYGNAMKKVNAYEGVTEFLDWAKRKNHVCKIISHKTKHPFRGPKYDLHSTAREWIETYFSNSNNILIEKKFIFFHQTKAEKIDQIGLQKCDIFVDDLPEILKAEKFPKGTRKILFDPCSHHLKEPNIERISHWDQLKTLLT